MGWNLNHQLAHSETSTEVICSLLQVKLSPWRTLVANFIDAALGVLLIVTWSVKQKGFCFGVIWSLLKDPCMIHWSPHFSVCSFGWGKWDFNDQNLGSWFITQKNPILWNPKEATFSHKSSGSRRKNNLQSHGSQEGNGSANFGAIIKVAANVAEHVEGLPLQWCMEFVDA